MRTISLISIFMLSLCFSGLAWSEQSEEEERSIPLNKDDPTIDLFKMKRDLSKDLRRPGPINIQRYPGGSSKSGIPTFFRLPVALTPEDLRAGAVDVAIMAAGLDMSTGMRGTAYGPNRLRIAENYLGWGVYSSPNMNVMVNWEEQLTVVDYGDAPVDPLSTERSVEPIRAMVREIAETGTIPFVIGGDHSLEYPNVAAMADVYGKANVGVIHFDSHYDASSTGGGHLISHAQPIRRLINEGHISGKNYIQVGLRGYWPGKDGFEWMREQGMRYHTMTEIERDGWDKVMKRVLKEAREGTEYLYISLDIDVLDPAYAPGTGTPEPGGLTPRELFPLIRALCSDNKLVGFDLVEFNPLVDPGYTTGLNADRLLRQCLTGIAMHKMGLEGKFLSPLTVEDDRR
jgi:agmatinase